MLDFDEFMSKEYEMLKDAHFQTSNKITSFFQYALLIFSAPIVLLTCEKNIGNTILGIVFTAISLIGFFVLYYLIQLRHESLLYARGINRIRNMVYSYSDKSTYELDRFKILMSQDKKPAYKDWNQFGGVVIALSIFDSLYFSYGIWNFISKCNNKCLWIVLAGAITLLSHIIMYKIVSCYNENSSSYYKRRIGIDIDGVLNLHEKQFVKIYNKLFNAKLKETDIITLPVSKAGIIDKHDERKVFTVSNYWDDMPANSDAIEYLNHEISERLGYKIYIFTWRDWKINSSINGIKCKYKMKSRTKKWIKNNKIKYKKLKFEKGNIDLPTSIFNFKYRTRYYYCKKYKIEFFIEDDLNNAIRLSSICKYVFLINHRYNESTEVIPYNIIRVNNWHEIYEHMKNFS